MNIDFPQIHKEEISNYKQISREQTGTKNRMFGIARYWEGYPIKIMAGTKSGNKSLLELIELFETKYKKLEERLSDEKIKFELVEIIR